MLVITGGEPLLQQSGLIRLFETDERKADPLLTRRVEVETAGTISPTKEFLSVTGHGSKEAVRFNISPKLAHSGNPHNRRYHPDVLRELEQLNYIFKFVVEDLADFEEVDLIVDKVAIHPSRVYIMPRGIEQGILNETSQNIAEAVISRHYNLTGRLHIALWGNARGH